MRVNRRSISNTNGLGPPARSIAARRARWLGRRGGGAGAADIARTDAVVTPPAQPSEQPQGEGGAEACGRADDDQRPLSRGTPICQAASADAA